MSYYKLHAVTEAGRWKNINEKDKAGVKERTDTSVFFMQKPREKVLRGGAAATGDGFKI